MGTAPFDEICARELPGTSRPAVWQTKMCHLENAGRGWGWVTLLNDTQNPVQIQSALFGEDANVPAQYKQGRQQE